MRRLPGVITLLALGSGIYGCSDTSIAHLNAIGKPAHIVCYSGDKVFLDTTSTGKVYTVSHSDGWEFKDATTGRLIRVSGNCLISN